MKNNSLKIFQYGILTVPLMWNIVPSDQYLRDKRHYEKKHPRELAAVLNNLDRYLQQLNSYAIQGKTSKCVQAGYLHNESKGVVAVDQRKGGVGLQETRLYTFALDNVRELHLILIGNKNTQSDDVISAADFAESLIEIGLS